MDNGGTGFRPEWGEERAVGRGTGLLCWGVAGLGVVAATAQLGSRPSPDVAWNLYVTRGVLAGGKLGIDFLENTPPMILALKTPAVVLAEVLGLREWTLWVVMVAALAGLTAALIARSLTAAGVGRQARLMMLTAMSVSLLLLPSQDFGQREHVMVILVLPYVALTVLRLRGTPIRVKNAVFVGFLAGVGIGIKPHFLVLPLALSLLLASRKSIRNVITPEHLTIVGVGLIYLVAVWVFLPAYFQYAADYAPLYQHFQTEFLAVGGRVVSPPALVVAAVALPSVPAYAALGAWMAIRRYQNREQQPFGDVLAVATAALLLVGVVQGKGWRYHFLPSEILAALTMTLLVGSGLSRPVRALSRIYLGFGAGILAATALSVVPTEVVRALHPRDAILDADPDLSVLLPLVREVGSGGHVAVFSTNIASSFPLVLESGARWALRHPNLWPLVAFYDDQVRGEALVHTREWALRPPLERQFSQELVDDLDRTKPALLVVLRSDAAVRGWGGARRFDYLGYFSATPGFATRIMPEYRAGGAIGLYDLYWRKPGPPPSTPTSAVSAPPATGVSLRKWTELLTITGFVLGLLGGGAALTGGRGSILSAAPDNVRSG